MRGRHRPWPVRIHPTRALLVGAVLVLAACGQTTANRPSPTPTAPSPSPIVGFQALYADPSIQGSPIQFFDSTVGQPRLVHGSVNQVLRQPRFAGTDRVSVLSPEGVVSADLNGSSRRIEVAGSFASHAWGPDGTVAAVEPADVIQGSRLVVRVPGRTPVTVSLPPYPAASERGTIGLDFSPDGRLLLVQAPFAVQPGGPPERSSIQVRRLDGTLLFGAPITKLPEVPTWAVWSADGTLYYTDPRGVVSVDTASGKARVVLADMHWSRPDVSPDGRVIVFQTWEGDTPVLHLLDVATGKVGGFARTWVTHPQFVSSTRLWLNEEAPCTQCMTPTQTLPSILGYDLPTRTESRTGLTGILNDFDFAVRQVRRT